MVLQKAHELEADRFGMELSDRRTVLRQYLRFGVAATALEEVFWPGYFHEAHDEPLPPKDSFKRVVRFLGALDDRNLLDAVKKALSKISLPYETHPSLRERLISLGYEIPEPEEVLAILSEGKETETRRASTLLTESCLAHYRDHYNRALKAVHIAEWRMRHQEAKKARGKYELLDTKKIDDTLSESDYWDWAHYRYRYIDKEQSCFAIYEFLQHFPNHAQANYILGEKELRQNKAEGVAFIEKALENDSDAMMPGLLLLAKFYEQRGDEKSLVRIMERKDQHLLSQKAANTERSKLRAGDEFSEADLSKTDKEDIRKVLSYYPELTEAYLVRKRVTHLADKPCYVLAVRFKKRSLELDMEREQIQLNCLANDLPPTIPIYVFAVNRLPSSVVNKIKNIDGAMIHITQVEKAN